MTRTYGADLFGKGHLVPETKRLLDRAEDARRKFEEAVKGLHRKGGSKKYSEAEHEERLRSLRAERNRELREVRQRAQSLFDQARQEVEDGGSFAPDAVLSDAERQQAASRLPLVQADVDGLDPSALASRLRAVLSGGNRVEQFAYLMAARRSPRARAGSAGEALRALDEALVGPARERRAREARERLKGAQEVLDIVWLAEREQRHAYAPERVRPGGGQR